jgi:hypothetical protein
LLNSIVPWRVLDLDDHQTLLPGAQKADMVGNDVYFITDEHKLFRLRGSALEAKPELVQDNVGELQRIDTARGSLLLLSPPDVDPFGPLMHSLFDPAVGKSIPMPGETAPSSGVTIVSSPSGRTLLISSVVGRGGLALTMFDRDTGETHTETLDAAVFGRFWRPGHEEVWLQTDFGVLRWRAGEAAPVRMPEVKGVEPMVRPSGSIFTPDGARFLSYGPVTSLRPVEDLSAPPLPLHSGATMLGAYWPLADGRGLTEAFKTYQSHNDISLVDPAAGTQRLLASGGFVVAAGAHRALVYLAYVKSTMSGTLALLDVDTGERTVLGEDVHAVALDTPASGTDALAPGTRVVFLVRSRIAGPYDGAWLAELP